METERICKLYPEKKNEGRTDHSVMSFYSSNKIEKRHYPTYTEQGAKFKKKRMLFFEMAHAKHPKLWGGRDQFLRVANPSWKSLGNIMEGTALIFTVKAMHSMPQSIEKGLTCLSNPSTMSVTDYYVCVANLWWVLFSICLLFT